MISVDDDDDDVRRLGDVTASALEYLRKETIDVYNRLHSIAEDARFVDYVHSVYPAFPILPNLRCGAWYTNPSIATRTPAYFKSTDGHFSNWSFNLRRANLHLLPLIASHHGLILVDSTRTGKRIPDALSKTVPIWCAVINRAVARRFPDLCTHGGNTNTWDGDLYTPPGAVSVQEHDQIAQRIEGWADALFNSSFSLPRLPAPLRPLWITPATTTFPSLPSPPSTSTSTTATTDTPNLDKAFLPVICVSASKQIHTRTEGFAYVQGSGDDHELWSMGLTPQLFWTHTPFLLTASRADLPPLIQHLVSPHQRQRGKTKKPPTPIDKVGGRVMICALGDVMDGDGDGDEDVAYILIHSETEPRDESPNPHPNPHPNQDTKTLHLTLPPGKRGQTLFLTHVLPAAVAFARVHFADAETGKDEGKGKGKGKGKEKGKRVCVACAEGRDVSVGVALVLVWVFFDGGGQLRARVCDDEVRVQDDEEKGVGLKGGREGKAEGKGEGEGEEDVAPVPDKKTLRTRLEWIIESRVEANPSRATLKRVNEYLMTPGVYVSGGGGGGGKSKA